MLRKCLTSKKVYIISNWTSEGISVARLILEILGEDDISGRHLFEM